VISFEKNNSLSFYIHPLTQFPRALESNNLSGCQHQIPAGGWVSTFTFLFFFDAEFPKTAYQYILPGLKGLFHDFKDGFDCFGGLFLYESVSGAYFIDNLGFG
jgi:hypothetical protein